MNKLIKIGRSPDVPPIEVAFDIVIQLHMPYSDTSVTVQINPNIQEYKKSADTEGVQVRQVIMTTPTDQTKVLSFNIESDRKHNINIEGTDYEIELINIGKENMQNQEFLFYEFNITKV